METMQKFFILLHAGRNLKKQDPFNQYKRALLLNLVRQTLRSYPGNSVVVQTIRSYFKPGQA
ncbi:unnamed protein product [marine sediment metagenome]|uniref:Uncharacterized protein n=1 Tax=marine sediment metagenome TaxID=412755 RepID=X1JLP5_9ZZZZ